MHVHSPSWEAIGYQLGTNRRGSSLFEGGLQSTFWGTKGLLLLASASRLLCPLDIMIILSIYELYQSFKEIAFHLQGLRGGSVFFFRFHG